MQIYDRNNNLVSAYQHNLLINGDFQINQRGQAEYNFSTSGNYGLDMWNIRQPSVLNSLIVKKVDNGVELTCEPTLDGCGLRQQLSLTTDDIGKKYTVCVSCNGVIKTHTFTLLSESQHFDIDDIYRINITRGSTNDYFLGIYLSSDNTREKVNVVNYIDLFEGNIAYPHVKEEYATTLMRCQRYLVVTTLSAAGCDRYKYGLANRTYSYAGHITINMVEPPKVIIDTEGAVFENCKDISATVNGNIGVSLAVTVINTSVYRVYGGKVIISCEPV